MPSQAPDKLNRFLAFLIDNVIAALLTSIPLLGGILSAGYLVARDGLRLEFMNQRSVGKHLMGLEVERADGRVMDLETSVQRNWMWGLGPVAAAAATVPLFGGLLAIAVSAGALAVALVEIYRVLDRPDGRRWGDELAQTQVVG
jgi:uncharacterized RDD family membrane protein YckC